MDMKYYKVISGGYITGVGKSSIQPTNAIDKSEYELILSIIKNKPPCTDLTDYRLKTDLTWEEYEVSPDPPDPDPDIDDAELLDILMGGAE